MSRATSPGLGLEHDGLRIRIRSQEPEVLRCLAQFLMPQFRQSDELDCDHEIRLIVDRELYGTILSRGPRGNDRRDVFGLDSDVERLPVWNSPNDDTIVFDETFKVFCSVGVDKRAVLLVAAAADMLVMIHLMRVVRELAMNEARRRERLLLHAAALEFAGRGVIIAGVKGAGKTTLLISLLRHAGARYVSNDRVLVDTVREPPLVRGMPTIISIRAGTLDMFPRVGQRLLTGGYDLRSEFQTTVVSTPSGRDGTYLSPAGFCELLGVQPLGEVDAAMLVFPSITPELRGWRLEPLRPASAARRLRPVLFGVQARRTSDFFGGLPLPDEATTSRLIEELTSRIPAFDCLLGPDAHADHSLPDRLLMGLGK